MGPIVSHTYQHMFHMVRIRRLMYSFKKYLRRHITCHVFVRLKTHQKQRQKHLCDYTFLNVCHPKLHCILKLFKTRKLPSKCQFRLRVQQNKIMMFDRLLKYFIVVNNGTVLTEGCYLMTILRQLREHSYLKTIDFFAPPQKKEGGG